MTTGSTANKGYAKGWGVNTSSGTWSHGGSLPGTSTLLWRTSDGYTMALLLNTRSGDEGFDLGEPLREVVKTVKNWPSIDLF